MADHTLTAQDLAVRHFVYTFWVENERPPTFTEAASHFDLSPEEGRAAYHHLHDAHQLFLNPGSPDEILMASPLSAIPTAYRAHVHGKMLYTN